MLSTNQRKGITALHRKKGREEQQAFLVEGLKCVQDLLAAQWPVERLYATEAWELPSACDVPLQRVTPEEMTRISALETATPVLAVARREGLRSGDPTRGRWLALDGIQDPGNLGTLLRLADWFGLEGLIASHDTVDVTHPKVVQASMGSLFRVAWREEELPALLAGLPAGHFCAGTFLEGENLYAAELPREGILVLGNEGRGIRTETGNCLKHRITIPRFGQAESLNVAMAAAVICGEWRRFDSLHG
jgi:TrmH family RNA methyltransferase